MSTISTTLRDRLARYTIPETPGTVHDPDAKLSNHERQPDELIALAYERLHRTPHDLTLVDWLASLLYANRRFEETIPLLERLARCGMATALTHFHLANSYHATGNHERAVDHWELVARRFEGSEIARKAIARLRYLYLSLRSSPASPARTA